MIASVTQQGNEIIFKFEMQESDIEHLDNSKIKMAKDVASVRLDNLKLSDIHPDLIGLSTILMSHQFIGKEIHLPMKVSNNFFGMVNGVLSRYKIKSEIDEKLEGIIPIKNNKPALSFSGGADSMAALAVMPGNTVPIFLNRPMSEFSIYNSDAPLETCKKLREVGYDVIVVDCDLEFLRQPIGFPSDLAHAVPAILLSRKMEFDSLSFGTVLESAFGIGHNKYINYAKGSHWRFYSTLLSAVGLQLSLPISGISEVGTGIIMKSSPLGKWSQSCIRGKFKIPCKNCWKCFRKELLSLALEPVKDVNIKKMMTSKEVQIRLSEYPISHENVIKFSINNININNYPVLKNLEYRVSYDSNINFLSKWYGPSIQFIPEGWRLECIEKIRIFLNKMNAEEENLVKNWDMTEFLEEKLVRNAHSKLTSSWQDI